MNRSERMRAATVELAAAGIENPRLEARVIFEHVFELEQTDDARAALFLGLVARRATREPLAYVIGRKEFWSLDFAVGPGALVPRPETETLIELALKAFPDRAAPLRILDLGTGSGCLLVTALTLYPNAAGTGIDTSAEALGWAQRNAQRHGVAGRSRFVEGGWQAALGQSYDLILANPPYLTEAELADSAPELGHEPETALSAGPDGLEAYRALGPVLAAGLAPEGRAFLEIGAGQAKSAAKALELGGLEILSITPDLSGIPRCLTGARRACAVAGLEKSVGNRGSGL